jgi:acetate kinase
MAAVPGGVDGLVFPVGIGENFPEIRARIDARCAWLGVEADAEANLAGGPRILARTSRTSAWACCLDWFLPRSETEERGKHLWL